MKYLLILWSLGGPQVAGVFESEQLCNDLASKLSDTSAIHFCARMDVDKLVSDRIMITELMEK